MAEVSNRTAPTDHSRPVREKKPGLMERLGVRFYRRLVKHTDELPVDPELPDDEILRRQARRITFWGGFMAFMIGAVTTVGSVWIEVAYAEALHWVRYYSFQYSVTLGLLIIEFAVLFYAAMATVHRLAKLTGHHDLPEDSLLPNDDQLPNLLARAALEVQDPVIQFLDIDPLKHVSKTKMLVFALLYKAKIFLTSAAARFILRRLFGKSLIRVSAAWVAVPITGIWNAYVLWKVAREARLRLFGHRLARHLAHEVLTQSKLDQLSRTAQLGCIRAVGNAMVLTSRYHPNMLLLILHLSDKLDPPANGDYDDWPGFLAVLEQVNEKERNLLLDLLAIAAAFDGRFSRRERAHLPEAFGAHTELYFARIKTLSKHLMRGELSAAKTHCALDFEVG